jgi:hypothetical protein
MRLMLMTIVIFMAYSVMGQVTDTVDLSLDFNSYIIFNTEDIKFNYGSSSVKVTLSGNKLILEGLEEEFNTTNLLVETDDKLYIFILQYQEKPAKFIYNYSNRDKKYPKTKIGNPVLIDSTKIVEEFIKKADETEKSFEQNAYHEQAKDLTRKIFTIGHAQYDITTLITNINVIGKDFMILRLEFINESDINYLMEYFEVVIADKKNNIKKNAVVEMPIKILSYSSQEKIIAANSTFVLTILIDKVTLSKKKKLEIRVIENNKDRRGDRAIILNIPFQYINKAKEIKK